MKHRRRRWGGDITPLLARLDSSHHRWTMSGEAPPDTPPEPDIASFVDAAPYVPEHWGESPNVLGALVTVNLGVPMVDVPPVVLTNGPYVSVKIASGVDVALNELYDALKHHRDLGL